MVLLLRVEGPVDTRTEETLTPRTDAFPPQIPQNRKVIGGGHSICELKRERQKQKIINTNKTQ